MSGLATFLIVFFKILAPSLILLLGVGLGIIMGTINGVFALMDARPDLDTRRKAYNYLIYPDVRTSNKGEEDE